MGIEPEVYAWLKRLDRRVENLEKLHEKMEPTTRSAIFVRRYDFVPPEIARLYDAVFVSMRTSRGRTNRNRDYYARLIDEGVEIHGWDWLQWPGTWGGVGELIDFAHSVGAKSLLINAEPKPRKRIGPDWRGEHGEMTRYMTAARQRTDRHHMELGFTGWAMPSKAPTFPWLEAFSACHYTVCQPYEVHGRSGWAYVRQALDEYRSYGARRVMCGRGAHELDDDDNDSWRTPEQIELHRRTTPPGFDEVWWPPKGVVPLELAQAMTAPRPPYAGPLS